MKAATKRTLSTHAQVAKAIRTYAKSIGVKCRAVSDSYSMGSSVDWYVENLHPETFSKLEEHAKQYQYGHFNGMEDIYEMSNRRDDIPQTKHVFGHRSFTPDVQEKAYQWLCEQSPVNAKDLPESYDDAQELNFSTGEKDFDPNRMVRREVYKILHGDDFNSYGDWREFWQTLAPKVEELKPLNNVNGVTIEEHTHTKKGFQMFICICPRMSREQYFETLEHAKSLNGWYSRKWGTTPAGFAFKELENAEKFVSSLQGDALETVVESQCPAKARTKPKANHAEKLRGLAEKLQKQIDDKNAPRLTNTPKRLKEANIARQEGDRLQRTQKALFALADLHEAENVPVLLEKFTTKKAVYDAMVSETCLVENGFHTYYSDTGKPRTNEPEILALWDLLTPKSEAEEKEREIKHKVEAIQFSKIAGYFPTPENVVQLMLENVDIKAGDKVLEPSAGSGAIADAVKGCESDSIIECCEVNHSLREILTLKGYDVIEHNFLDLHSGGYDVVLMNPPFENLQDIEHIQHAYSLLKSGGRLVAIMSPSAFFRMDKKSEAFRSWFYSLNGLETDLPENSFKDSGTGVNTKLIVLDK